MASKKFDPKKLRMLSPDADDWSDLVNLFDWLNSENNIHGVLLYPKIGISENRAEDETSTWLENQPSIGHGSLDTRSVDRGDDWAIIYRVSGWYNHFDLNEEYD